MKIKILSIIAVSAFLISCASMLIKHDFESTTGLSEDQYSQHASNKATVLLAANWSRSWNCGGFENAELRSIGFDLLPEKESKTNLSPDFVVNGSAGRPGFMNYAFMLEPGTYAISHIKIKVAKSVSDVGYYTAKRSELFEAGTPKGGTFDVTAGEVVYIGHFGLDCAQQPMAWRYYAEDKDNFDGYVATYKAHYPYLSLGNVQYRLFKTKEFGHDFSL